MAASPSTLAVIAYALYPQLLTVQAPIKRPAMRPVASISIGNMDIVQMDI
jgi:hypothetical protein